MSFIMSAVIMAHKSDDGSSGWSAVGAFGGKEYTLALSPELLLKSGVSPQDGLRVEAVVNRNKVKSLSHAGDDPFRQDEPVAALEMPAEHQDWERPLAQREILQNQVGRPFHNPYTFLPFPEQAPTPRPITPRTADERRGRDRERKSGIIDLKVTTRTPLRTVHPEGREHPLNENHKVYEALTIGPDVVVPSTGIRGALRSLMTILTGGPVAYMDEEAILCQGRDLDLGCVDAEIDLETLHGNPDNELARAIDSLPRLHLGEVVVRGGRACAVRVGETRLVSAQQCTGKLHGGQLDRSRNANAYWAELEDLRGQVASVQAVHRQRTEAAKWKLKLSGRPVGPINDKFEGALNPDGGSEIDLPDELWREYEERHRYGETKGKLKAGDLVWLEPGRPDLRRIEHAGQIKSIQWARWGRRGVHVHDLTPEHIWPDARRDDGQVAEVTDLFGHLAASGTFAGRVRPENLVFRAMNAHDLLLEQVLLAPLSAPRPGCIAFYRRGTPENVTRSSFLRGYKVYRTQATNGEPAPWLDSGPQGEEAEHHNTNQTCDLVKPGVEGTLRIAFRGLTSRELGLLLFACNQPWRLGGGKPLGLGLCRVEVERVVDEFGAPISMEDSSVAGDEQLVRRAEMWQRSQEPVPKLRYPRMAMNNQRGGHVWFSYFAAPNMNRAGLQQRTPVLGGPRVDGQMLPRFQDAPNDRLYGYDRTRQGPQIVIDDD